jgi:hypothetical protein
LTAAPYLTGAFTAIEGYNNYKVFNNVAKVEKMLPQATVLSNRDSICRHQYISLFSSTDDIFLQHQWHFPGGLPDTSALPNPVVQYLASGAYAVYDIITNKEGVDTVFTDSIHVENCSASSIEKYDNVWMHGYSYYPSSTGKDPLGGVDFYYTCVKC